MSGKPFQFEQLFDVGGGGAGAGAGDVAEAETQAPPPEFTAEELEAARAAAFAAGHAEGVAEGHGRATAEAEARTTAANEMLAARLQDCCALASAAAEAAAGAATVAAAKALEHAFPAFAERHGAEDICAVLREAIARAGDEPRLVARFSAEEFDVMDANMTAIAKAAGFGGRVVTLEDADLAPGDARVEWADGGVLRDNGRLTAAVAEAISAVGDTLAAQSQTDAPAAADADHQGPSA